MFFDVIKKDMRIFDSEMNKEKSMRKFVIGLLSVCFVFFANAQKIEEVFVKMPDTYVVQLEEAWRKDLLDLYNSGKTATLENTMQGKSTLLKLTDDYLLLQSTTKSVVELKLLPLLNNTYIICMVETVYGPVADSRVSFHTTEWEPLSAVDVFVPVDGAWFLKEDADRLSPDFLDVVSRLDMHLVKYNLHADHTNLTAVYMTPAYLDEEFFQKAQTFLKGDSKIYEWKSGRFE